MSRHYLSMLLITLLITSTLCNKRKKFENNNFKKERRNMGEIKKSTVDAINITKKMYSATGEELFKKFLDKVNKATELWTNIFTLLDEAGMIQRNPGRFDRRINAKSLIEHLHNKKLHRTPGLHRSKLEYGYLSPHFNPFHIPNEKSIYHYEHINPVEWLYLQRKQKYKTNDFSPGLSERLPL